MTETDRKHKKKCLQGTVWWEFSVTFTIEYN